MDTNKRLFVFTTLLAFGLFALAPVAVAQPSVPGDGLELIDQGTSAGTLNAGETAVIQTIEAVDDDDNTSPVTVTEVETKYLSKKDHPGFRAKGRYRLKETTHSHRSARQRESCVFIHTFRFTRRWI